MSVKPILTEPNKLLRQISKPVENVGDEERRLMDDMLDTMYAYIVSSISSISLLSSSPTFSTGLEICLNSLFGSVKIGLTDIMTDYFSINFKLLKEEL